MQNWQNGETFSNLTAAPQNAAFFSLQLEALSLMLPSCVSHAMQNQTKINISYDQQMPKVAFGLKNIGKIGRQIFFLIFFVHAHPLKMTLFGRSNCSRAHQKNFFEELMKKRNLSEDFNIPWTTWTSFEQIGPKEETQASSLYTHP